VSTVLASVAAYTVLLTLVAACLTHVRHPAGLPAALISHQVVPRPVPLAVAVTTLEGVLAALLMIGLLRDAGSLLAAVLGFSAVVFAGYGGYAWYVVAAGRDGSCGCGRVDVPMSGWVAGRACGLAALASAGAALSGSVVSPAEPDSLVVLLAAGTFATVLWHLPAAMREAVR
jgi:hypothetical protein